MGTRAQSSAAVAPTLCTPRTRSLHRIALRNISGGEHGFRVARFLDVLGSEVRYRRAHRPPRQRAAHPRALSSGRQPCAIPGAGMWVADFPRAPARLCAQRMIAPLRLRSRAYLDRTGLSSTVLLRVVGLARSRCAPSARFRSIALLLLTSAPRRLPCLARSRSAPSASARSRSSSSPPPKCSSSSPGQTTRATARPGPARAAPHRRVPVAGALRPRACDRSRPAPAACARVLRGRCRGVSW